MTLWTDKKLFDRILDKLEQRERGYIKFNKARGSIATYFRPDLDTDTSPDGDSSFFGSNIYEGTGAWAVGVMSRGFQGGIISEASDWILYQMGQSELKGVDELDMWVQDIKEHMSEVYQRSNIYRVLPPFTKDGVTIGSPLMFIEEEIPSQTIQFLPQHYKTVFIFYDKFNRPEGVIIKDERWTVKQIFDKFAPSIEKAGEKLSLAISNELKDGLFHREHTIIRAVFKNSDPIWDVKEFKKPLKDWISVYFEKDTKDERKNTPLLSEDYFTRPFVVWDYDKKPYESVSRTPAFEAIYDVISQQQVHKNYLENIALKNRPPHKILPDYRNKIDFSPEGMNFIEKTDWEHAPAAIDVVGDVLLNKDLSAQIGEAVKRWFHTDKFLKFTDLTTTLKQQPSATQIIKMAAEIAIQLITGISTYTGGFLRSVDDRVMDIESRAGRGPFAPDIMANITDIVVSNSKLPVNKIKIVPIFVGLLARAQKVKQELDPILDGLGVAKVLFEEYPNLKFAIREYDTLEDVFKAVNFPLKNFKPEEEYNQIVVELNEAKQRLEQQAMMLEAAKVAPNLSKNVEPDSILAVAGAG